MIKPTSEQPNAMAAVDRSKAQALYLDGIYVPDKVMDLVIENIEKSGFLPKKYSADDHRYRWIKKMVEHHLLILALEDRAKDKNYAPASINCLNQHIQEKARSVLKAIVKMLTNYYPSRP